MFFFYRFIHCLLARYYFYAITCWMLISKYPLKSIHIDKYMVEQNGTKTNVKCQIFAFLFSLLCTMAHVLYVTLRLSTKLAECNLIARLVIEKCAASCARNSRLFINFFSLIFWKCVIMPNNKSQSLRRCWEAQEWPALNLHNFFLLNGAKFIRILRTWDVDWIRIFWYRQWTEYGWYFLLRPCF